MAKLLTGILFLLAVGCLRDTYQECCTTCHDLTTICTQGAKSQTDADKAVEYSRMCMESSALCYRACGTHP